MKKMQYGPKKKISRYVIAMIVLIIVILIGQGVMKFFAEMKYKAQRDQGTDIVEWEIGVPQQICGCDVMIKDVDWSTEAEIEIPDDQQMVVVRYEAQGEALDVLKIGTLAYMKIEDQYISSKEYIEGMQFLKKPTVYSHYIDKEQGELAFIVPEAEEELTFIVQEYDDNVEPQQIKGSMLKYEPYEAPVLIHQYEIVLK